MPDSVAPRYTPLLLVLEHGDGGRKTVDALKVLIDAKADVDAGVERSHRWESVLMKRDQLSDEVFALLCKHSKRDGGDVRLQMQEKRFQAAFIKVVRAKKPAAVANLSAQHKLILSSGYEDPADADKDIVWSNLEPILTQDPQLGAMLGSSWSYLGQSWLYLGLLASIFAHLGPT